MAIFHDFLLKIRKVSLNKKINKFSFYLKIIISISLILFLLFKVDWTVFKSQILLANPYILLIVLGLRAFQFIISSIKWKYCLAVFNLKFTFAYLLKTICIGFYYNNFLPGSIGGDGYRIYKTMPLRNDLAKSVSAAFFERFTGFFILLLMGLVTSFVFLQTTSSGPIGIFVISGSVSIVVMSFLILLIRLGLFNKLYQFLKARPKLKTFFDNKIHIIRNKNKILSIVIISIIFHLMAFLSIKILFLSLHTDITLIHSSIIVALTVIISLLPVSINGIGITETTFVYTSLQVGIPYDKAIIAAFLNRAITLFLSLLCGGIHLFENFQENK